MIIKIIYDNDADESSSLRPDWGFSCLIRYPHKTWLFDTGGNGELLLYNMAQLGIDPREINNIAISHTHGDHIGGLASLLQYKKNLTVYLPISSSLQLKSDVRAIGAKVEEVDKARELEEGVYTTGELDGGIKEQSLILKTPRGLVVVTGCAHPGIVNIASRAKEIGGEKLYLLLGGFHLNNVYRSQINVVAEKLLDMGVEKVSPCHCSGEEAKRAFENYFGNNYIRCGVEKEIVIE